MKKVQYYVIICNEIDMFEGMVTHINKKASNLKEVNDILEKNVDKYPNALWHISLFTVNL